MSNKKFIVLVIASFFSLMTIAPSRLFSQDLPDPDASTNTPIDGNDIELCFGAVMLGIGVVSIIKKQRKIRLN